MDPITLGIIASVAGAGLNAYAGNQAAKRAQQQSVEMQRRQFNARNAATDTAMRRVQDFDPTARQQRQDQIQQEMTGQFEKTVAQPQITAQGVSIGSTLPAGQGGGDFLAAQAREETKRASSLRALAALMGRTGSAGELRRREAIDFGDTAGDIGRIQTGANNIAGIDSIGVEAAGRPDMLTQIAAAGLSAYGMGKMAGGGSWASAAPVEGTGLSMEAPRGMGLRMGAGGVGGMRAPSNWLGGMGSQYALGS